MAESHDTAPELHFVSYRRSTKQRGVTIGFCSCGWMMRGTREAVQAASATHDLDAATREQP